ncbi:cyclopropane-fatty-acyl-phospholipid synthase family protein [Streptomyces sp. NPDC005408]|uniref:cyclopropane-fatty-acyl-phospholipid synthase family protein n=1 Tax=Streptomyces sp. NPDC005408 TaxID=3155341 RepID=UPI0033A1EC9E
MSPASWRTASVDAHRWPDVARLPKYSRLRTAVAERLVRHALGRLPLRARIGGGDPIGKGGPLMDVYEPDAVFQRIGADGLVGFGESYLAGEWEARDLVGVLTVLAEHAATFVPRPFQRLGGAPAPRQPAGHQGPRRPHLSSELLALFLDETMTYSSALFRGFPAEQHLLAAAQHRKIDRLLDLAQVGGGTQLLELGTGSGELAIRAAQRGARVLTVALSREQQELARVRIRDAGLQDRVTVLLRDYRRVLGRFDAIVSVEMIEAVGEEFWVDYFMTLDRLLAPGGRVALQAITMPHDRLPDSCGTRTWVQKYIVPGGPLPSTEAIEQIVTRRTGLTLAERDGFGPHYAETLRLWRQRFDQHAAHVDALGFDDTFRRMWTFYLAHSEARFRSGTLDVEQLLLTKAELAE